MLRCLGKRPSGPGFRNFSLAEDGYDQSPFSDALKHGMKPCLKRIGIARRDDEDRVKPTTP